MVVVLSFLILVFVSFRLFGRVAYKKKKNETESKTPVNLVGKTLPKTSRRRWSEKNEKIILLILGRHAFKRYTITLYYLYYIWAGARVCVPECV
jgi:hypothetical protein